MSRRRRNDGQNLDSLLDTMANVTGILVVLLAVMQISVGDAMERLKDELVGRPELSREAMAAAEEEARELRGALAPLLPDAAEREALRRERRAELSALRASVATLDRELEAGRGAPRGAAEIERRRAAARETLQRLERALAAETRERSDLEQKLARPVAATARDARLPDPRPAPVGAREIAFFVRHGRILRVDGQELVDRLWGAIRQATGGSSPESIQRSAIDRSRVLRWFESNDVGDANLRWHVLDVGGTLTGQLAWRRRDAGETTKELRVGNSRYRSELLQHSPQRVYLRFFVWDDSFDVYLAARALSDQIGYSAGWVPFEAHTPFRQSLVHQRIRAFVD
ncbi:MAG: hypothetical protein ACQGVC_25185 [Myxococcota bacterium]